MVVKEERRRVKLLTGKGMSEVEIRKYENEWGFSFTSTGWEEFVDEHGLQLGDFLVFEDMGNLIFKVTLFDPTCCEKGSHAPQETSHTTTRVRLDPTTKGSARNDHSDVKVKANEGDEENEAQREIATTKCMKRKRNAAHGVKDSQKREESKRDRKKRQLTSTMKDYNIHAKSPFLYLSKAFCKASGLVPQKAKVTLKGPSGEEHQGCIVVYERQQGGSIHTQAWRGFVASNNLKVGDTCVFKLRDTAGSSANGVVFDVEVHAAP